MASNDGLMCRLDPIRPSVSYRIDCICCCTNCWHLQPIQSGYRNKCEFTVAMDTSSSRPVVGFRLGSYEEGEFSVVTAGSCTHVPKRMKDIAMVTICGVVNDMCHYLY